MRNTARYDQLLASMIDDLDYFTATHLGNEIAEARWTKLSESDDQPPWILCARSQCVTCTRGLRDYHLVLDSNATTVLDAAGT